MIYALVATGHPVLTCCRMLGVSKPGYYRYQNRPLAPTKMRRRWLTGRIREAHTPPPEALKVIGASAPS